MFGHVKNGFKGGKKKSTAESRYGKGRQHVYPTSTTHIVRVNRRCKNKFADLWFICGMPETRNEQKNQQTLGYSKIHMWKMEPHRAKHKDFRICKRLKAAIGCLKVTRDSTVSTPMPKSWLGAQYFATVRPWAIRQSKVYMTNKRKKGEKEEDGELISKRQVSRDDNVRLNILQKIKERSFIKKKSSCIKSCFAETILNMN